MKNHLMFLASLLLIISGYILLINKSSIREGQTSAAAGGAATAGDKMARVRYIDNEIDDQTREEMNNYVNQYLRLMLWVNPKDPEKDFGMGEYIRYEAQSSKEAGEKKIRDNAVKKIYSRRKRKNKKIMERELYNNTIEINRMYLTAVNDIRDVNKKRSASEGKILSKIRNILLNSERYNKDLYYLSEIFKEYRAYILVDYLENQILIDANGNPVPEIKLRTF